ncbi:MAG: SMC family ATPase, partial [Anaerolineae bacterium]
MIPLQLRVHNFMCYRDDVPPLAFDGIHLACLAGANGHGKSALLDAMTWALWGKARTGRADELIHLGESEMEVEFTFDLGGNVYRVLRKRDSSGRGRTLLDLQVQLPDSPGEFRSIAESGVRATQDAIVRLLRMDYETFTNSAFLVQGRADAFTTRTPAERKKVLGEILGLGIYDEYEQRAKDMAREKDRELGEIDGLLREIDRELAREEQYETELAQARRRVDELTEAVAQAEEALQALRQEQQALEHQRARLQDLRRRLAQADQEVGEIESQIETRRERLAGYEALLARRAEVEAGYGALVEARRAEVAWNERLAEHARLQDEQRQAERAADAARHELELDRGRLAQQAGDLARRAGGLAELERDLAETHEQVAALAEAQAEMEAARAGVQTLGEESAGLQVRNEQMRAEMDALRAKLDVLTGEDGEAACPVCGQPLAEAHRQELMAEFQDEGERLRDAYLANEARRREIKVETERLEAQIRRLEGKLAALPAQQRREAQLEQSLAEAQQAEADLAPARDELAAVEARLASDDYAPQAQARLEAAAAALESLGYEPAAHQAARDKAAELAEFEAEQQRLQTALERVDEERQALADLQARQARW